MPLRTADKLPSPQSIRSPQCQSLKPLLLYAASVGIWLRLIDDDSVVHVRDVSRNIRDQIRDRSQMRVVNVLRLICQLMVVAVTASREERDRNSVARVLVVVAAAIDLLRVSARVERVVEREVVSSTFVHRLDNVAKLSRQ